MTATIDQLPASMQDRIAITSCPIDGLDGDCWIWSSGTNNRGYGPHRRTYERLVGPITAGLELDHLCEVKPCINPAHLEPVTLSENKVRAVLASQRRRDEWFEAHPWEPRTTA